MLLSRFFKVETDEALHEVSGVRSSNGFGRTTDGETEAADFAQRTHHRHISKLVFSRCVLTMGDATIVGFVHWFLLLLCCIRGGLFNNVGQWKERRAGYE
jgi:hypothetical protein